MPQKTILAAIAIAIASTGSFAQTQNEAILNSLNAKYPTAKFTAIRSTPLQGIFEVVSGKSIGYTDEKGKYFIFGDMYDMPDRVNLAANRRKELGITDPAQPQAQAAQGNISWAALPLADAMLRVKGNGQRKIAVFTDPDCPFCKRLEPELEKLNNVSIYTFLYPIKSLHPNAPEKSKSIWCAGNIQQRNAAWLNQMLNAIGPTSPTNCVNPIDRNIALAQKLGINGTPTMFSQDGQRLVGSVSSGQLELFLASTVTKK